MVHALLIALALNLPADKPQRLRHPNCVYPLSGDEAIWVRNPKRAWGTKKAVTVFEKAVWSVRQRFENTPRIPVGDLSFHGGGRMKPHRSHRDGRDIDAGYYFKDGRFRKWFGKPKYRQLDTAKQWALFKTLIDTGELEYVFVSYRLQKALYRYAIKHGETKRSLRRLIQWPRHWRYKTGIIRWERGHDDHFHARFKK